MDPQITNQPERRIPLGKVAVGLTMLLFGALAFTNAMDVLEYRHLWKLWPVFLIFIGVASEIDSLRQRTGGGGYVVAAIGVWMLVGNFRFFGLTHRTAFPLAVAVAGLGMILHALFDVPAARKEKS